MELLQIDSVEQKKNKRQQKIYSLIINYLDEKNLFVGKFKVLINFQHFMFNALMLQIRILSKNEQDYIKNIDCLFSQCKEIFNNYYQI